MEIKAIRMFDGGFMSSRLPLVVKKVKTSLTNR